MRDHEARRALMLTLTSLENLMEAHKKLQARVSKLEQAATTAEDRAYQRRNY